MMHAFMKKKQLLGKILLTAGLKMIMIMMKINQKKVGHFQHGPLLDICFMLDLQVWAQGRQGPANVCYVVGDTVTWLSS